MLEKYRSTALELDTYYRERDTSEKALVAELSRLYGENSHRSIYAVRAALTDWLCKNCEIKVFEHFPFFSEINAGRHRHSWGGLNSPVGRFLLDRQRELWLDRFRIETQPDRDAGFLHNWDNPVGVDHFCLGYDKILSRGFSGIIADIDEKLGEDMGEEEREFLVSAKSCSESLLSLAERFSREAERLFCETGIDNYRAIAAAASRVPKYPAETLYEAMCAVFFCRECISTLEGFGVSTWGQLDRMLAPYLEADLARGRIDMAGAAELFHMLLAYTDVRFESETQYNETSTTIVLGGCDRNGSPIFNDVTKLILHAALDGRYISTKLNCRISSKHPREYFDLLSDIQSVNLAVFVMQNDEVIIPALVKRGIALEDARLYVGGGCHEILPANNSVCTRADTWISLPRLVLAAMEGEEPGSFEDFYQRFLSTVQSYILRIEGLKNKYEALWSRFSPMPLCSATIEGCVETCRDLTAGGAKYSNTALSLLGVGTFADSLLGIKTLVYDEKMLTLEELGAVLKDNFKGNERIRAYLVNRAPKYGRGDVTADALAARALKDISGMFGQKNGRGGDYLPAIYPHDIYRNLGAVCPATPDGRKAGEYLSRGCSPGETTEVKSPLDIIQSLGSIDLTDYAESVCAEITLPRMEPSRGKQAFVALVDSFLAKGGSSMQFNLVDRELLLEAKRHPERHGDIIVRVCGYSAVFVALDEERQNDMIARAVRDM